MEEVPIAQPRRRSEMGCILKLKFDFDPVKPSKLKGPWPDH